MRQEKSSFHLSLFLKKKINFDYITFVLIFWRHFRCWNLSSWTKQISLSCFLFSYNSCNSWNSIVNITILYAEKNKSISGYSGNFAFRKVLVAGRKVFLKKDIKIIYNRCFRENFTIFFLNLFSLRCDSFSTYVKYPIQVHEQVSKYFLLKSS